MAETAETTVKTLGQPLPWSADESGDRRYAAILVAILAPILLLGVLMPLLPMMELPQEDEEQQVPERLAELMVEQQEPEPEPAPEPEPERQQQEPEPEPTESPRTRARESGVLAFSEDLEALRENQAAENVRRQRELQQGEVRSTPRRLITSNAGAGSTGIESRRGSRTGIADGTELAGRSDERVAGPAGGGRVGTPGGGGGGGGQATRSLESIQVVFDRNKQALFAMYQRALRSNPALQGTVVLRLEIQPSGEVTGAEIVSSELNDAELEGKIVNRVKLFDFGAKDVPVWRGRYPIDFFPS